jgi:hypothetical protein
VTPSLAVRLIVQSPRALPDKAFDRGTRIEQHPITQPLVQTGIAGH